MVCFNCEAMRLASAIRVLNIDLMPFNRPCMMLTPVLYRLMLANAERMALPVARAEATAAPLPLFMPCVRVCSGGPVR